CCQRVEVTLLIGIEIDIHLDCGVAAEPGVDAEAECSRSLQRIHNVQIMCPGFGEVLPRMGPGIATYMTFLPIGQRAVRIMRSQGCGIVTALIAEHLPEGFVPNPVLDKALPIIVTHFMTKMAENCSVRLRHVAALAFAFGIVGLSDVDGDQPVSMTCEHLRSFLKRSARAGEEVECKALLGILEPV